MNDHTDNFVPHDFKSQVKLVEEHVPKILISKSAYNTMWHIVNIAQKEVGWLGLVRQEGSDFLIEDVMLFEQEVSAVTCEITPEGLAEVAMELMAANPDDPEILNRLRFWGHSHVNMGTSASAQDESQMEIFASSGSEFFIRAILNKRGRMEFTLFLYGKGLRIDDAPWEIVNPIDRTLEEAIKAEFDAKVTEMTYTFGGYGGYRDNDGKWILREGRWVYDY